MNVLFCNIAWMKYYEGASDDDKPINGGSYVSENGYGHECFNFQDYNSKCYGFFMLYGNMNLESHFKDAKKHQTSLKDVLVIWVATNDTNETRIVGWYKNATVYREQQFMRVFINEDCDLSFRIEAFSQDCYLLPEEERTFPIQRAAQSGIGTGMGQSNVWYGDSSFAQTVLVPQVIEYINSYNGERNNIVYTDEILNEVLDETYSLNDYKKLYDEGIRCTQDDYVGALKIFNTARLIKETPEVLSRIAENLAILNCYNKAIPLFEKVIELEGSKVQTLRNLLYCYDYIGNRQKIIEYCNEIINILDDSEESKDEKITACWIMFRIYISLRDKKNAGAIIDRIPAYSNDEAAKNYVKEMKTIIKEEFSESI